MAEPGQLLQVRDLYSGYGDLVVVRNVSMGLTRGHIYLLLGRNGAGKTTLLLTLAGLLPTLRGEISFMDQRIDRLSPHARISRGLALVQEGKRVFRRLTVEQNLRLGLYSRSHGRAATEAALEAMYKKFPALQGRRRSPAGSLSGGQQQMLAIAQALMPDPDVVLLDEPSAGLAPTIVRDVMKVISGLKSEGKTILLVEQAIQYSLPIADEIGVMDRGNLVFTGPANQAEDVTKIRDLYLGVGSTSANRSPE